MPSSMCTDGFDNLRAWHDQNPTPGNVNRMVQVDYLEHRLDEMQKAGVHPYGRVGQDDLAKAFRNCIAWLYPTSFCETLHYRLGSPGGRMLAYHDAYRCLARDGDVRAAR